MIEKMLKGADISKMFKTAKIKPCPDDASIARLVDGSAGQKEGQAIRQHCAGCPECRRLLDDLILLYSAKPVEPTASFRQRYFSIIGGRKPGACEVILALSGKGLRVVESLLPAASEPKLAFRESGGYQVSKSFKARAQGVKWLLRFSRTGGKKVDLQLYAGAMPGKAAAVALYAGNRMVRSSSYLGKELAFKGLKPGRYQILWQGGRGKAVNFSIEEQ